MTLYIPEEPRRGGWVKTNFKMVQTTSIAMLEHKTTNDNHQRQGRLKKNKQHNVVFLYHQCCRLIQFGIG